jgi:hypothetical protein
MRVGSLEPLGNVWPRGMITVFYSVKEYRTRLTVPPPLFFRFPRQNPDKKPNDFGFSRKTFFYTRAA